ncbi:MAG: hypothetical protein LBR49_02725 [Tannerella sp.]|jgi:hypothetical protein|nr:hypothetical protein [Tannerella sp.]
MSEMFPGWMKKKIAKLYGSKMTYKKLINRSMWMWTVVFSLVATATLQAQSLVNDAARTGPMQPVTVNVTLNDALPCSDYVLTVGTINPVTGGTATTLSGGFIVFTPAQGVPATGADSAVVIIPYTITCGAIAETAQLRVVVTKNNLPANVIPHDVFCYNDMATDVTFGIHKKFESSHHRPNTTAGYNASREYPDTANADGFQAPLVADLNGDGKPEIIIMGQYGATSVTDIIDRYVMVYNGQTGKRILQFDLRSLGASYGVAAQMHMGMPYHRAPSNMAIADLNGDGKAEVVVSETGTNGKIYALTPTVNGNNELTGFTKFWDGNIGGTPTNYKLPNTDYDGGYSTGKFCYPMPYIADLNGDGTPEVIVYNKIFSGADGRLLMSWQAGSSGWKASSVTATDGLSDVRYDNNLCDQTQATAVRAVAMTGRRASSETYSDFNLAVPAVVDIDGDGQQEIITGNRIHKFQFNSLSNHTANMYRTIEGPTSITLHTDPSNSSSTTTFYLSDGLTRVADIDDDGYLDIIVASYSNDNDLYDRTILVYVYDPRYPTVAKAGLTFYADTEHGGFSIPFVGDINGKLDGGWNGTAYTKKLPEICILSGAIWINRNTSDGGRSGIYFHGASGTDLRQGTASSAGTAAGWDNNQTTNTNRRFNKVNGGFGAVCGHIIGLTWDDNGTTNIDEKLKLSWGMEHSDNSNNTGITLFDFDNNNTYDICYRDNISIRVISPKISGKDYVTLSETPGAGSSVMFKDDCVSATAFEYPTIADINMDGSADIVVAEAYGTTGSYTGYAAGWVSAYEYQGEMWAPCPPVWNQGMYDPTQIREDLQINARPLSMLTQYQKNSETITPFNGSWIQQPIVKDEADYVPVVRHPDANFLNMTVHRISATQTTVTLDIFNNGTATINALTPIAFYNGGTTGNNIASSTLLTTIPVGVDIFPNELKTLTYTLTGYDSQNKLVWARITDSGTNFPATGYSDCDLTNNSMSGSDCPNLSNDAYIFTSDSVLCGPNGAVELSVHYYNNPSAPHQYQWYFNNHPITGATDSTYIATEAGQYKCYVYEVVCRAFTDVVTIRRIVPVTHDDYVTTLKNQPVRIPVYANDSVPGCHPTPVIIAYQPQHGTLTFAHDTVIYTPNADYIGTDVFTYSIVDSSDVHIVVYGLPDNVDTASCTVPLGAMTFSIRQQWETSDVAGYSSPMVGDLDGDGVPEIVAMHANLASGGWAHQATAYDVFNGQTGALRGSIPMDGIMSATSGWSPVFTGLLVDANRNGKGEIVVIQPVAHTIESYEVTSAPGVTPMTFNRLWASSFTNPSTTDYLPHPVVTDFNGDSIPEIVVYNQIFNARTGALLGTTESSISTAYVGRIVGRLGNQNTNFLTVSDFDGDGLPEIAAGGKVYKVGFNASKTSVTCTIWRDYAGGVDIPDGYTAVADINMDGKLDVVVVSFVSGNTVIDVWTPETNTRVGSRITVSPQSDYQGFPFVGDIDGKVNATTNKKYPEICVTTLWHVHAYAYDPVSNSFSVKWDLPTSDGSGATGITLFDFNNDGTNELIYRDETVVRILDGSADGVAPTKKDSFQCYSGTAFEYPTIADTDGDGSANICLTCCSHVTTNWDFPTYLRVYESATQPWAPTRPVWNQVNYEPLQINDDLTVPVYSIPKNFPTGGNGHLYNGQLIQVPEVNSSFTVSQTAADPAAIALWSAQPNDTIVRFYLRIDNLGAMNTNAALPVALFNASTPPPTASDSTYSTANLLAVKTVGHNILHGTSDTIWFDIPKRLLTSSAISVRIQDNGVKYPALGSFLDCVYGNNNLSGSFVIARNDTIAAPLGCDNDTIISVLTNDLFPGGACTASTATVAIVDSGRLGTVQILGDKRIRYTVHSTSYKADTFRYSISCSGQSSIGTVIVASTYESAFVDNIWYWGRPISPATGSPGIKFVETSPGVFVPTDISNVSKVNTSENSHVVSSPYCQDLIFYGHHNQVFNNEHVMMTYGWIAGHSSTADGLASCYMGDNRYMLFAVTDQQSNPRGLRYYVIDMSAFNGTGAIISVDTIEVTGEQMSETIELVPVDGTTNQYWLLYAYKSSPGVGAQSDLIRVRKVTVNGAASNPVIGASTDYPKHFGSTYSLVSSPDYRRIAVVTYSQRSLDVYDFDNRTGVLFNRRELANTVTGIGTPYSACFSPDGNQLYVSGYKNISSTEYCLVRQYSIDGVNLVSRDSIQYWDYGTTAAGEDKGGGLKLAPDGKIYVEQNGTNKVGAISNPNAITSLSSRYNINAFTLSITYGGLEFSTGLTKPAIIPCNDNMVPVTVPDAATINAASHDTLKVNVLRNDSDPDGDTIFLSSAHFLTPTDTALATLTVNPADSTVHLVIKPGVSVPDGYSFVISYTIQDDGTPASRCNDGTLTVTVAYSTVFVLQTVQEYQSVEINIFDSLNLPSAFYATTFNLADSLVHFPVSGSVTMTGAGSSARLIYTNEGASQLSNHVDVFGLSISTTNGTYDVVVYIYVLSATDPTTLCLPASHTLTLAEIPPSVTFTWYLSETTPTSFNSGSSGTINFTTVHDTTIWIKPTLPSAVSTYGGDFPRGKFTLWGVSGSPTTSMRWTGLKDNNWHNPHNWVGVDPVTQAEYPVACEPTSCINVIISSNVPNYPELVHLPRSMCYDITMLDRAMLKNPHGLSYHDASIELIPTATERDRFVMWSAPMKGVYSGDYHFGVATSPDFGDVYMNYFQRANPNGGVAAANTFTATFGEPNDSLSLGTAFNLKVVSTTRSKNQPFIFPQTVMNYWNREHTQNYVIPATPGRTNGTKFITYGTTLSATDTTFNMPIGNDVAGSTLMQVVNPYLAYLDVTKFIAANSSKISSGYIFWNGDDNHSLDALLIPAGMISGNGNRYVITTPPNDWSSVSLVPPLQSFFVQKAVPASRVDSVKMSPNWTTTLSSVVDKSGLATALSVANQIMANASLYYPASLSGMAATIASAQIVYYDGNATQAQVNSAQAALVTAIAKARLKPVTGGGGGGGVNKSGLATALSVANSILANASLYYPASLAGLDAAVTSAQAVYNNSSATQAQVDAAQTALVTRIAAARLKPVSGEASLKLVSPASLVPVALLSAFAPAEWGILRIHAVQGDKQSYAVLNYDENATSAFNGAEDVQTLFYDEIPLTVYTLTPMREALSINSDGDFEAIEIPIGLRIRDAGEVTLDFSGMETFGHDVWLMDRARNVTIDLQETPQYSLTITKSGTTPTDVIDRLTLRFEYTGKGLVDSEPVVNDLVVTAGVGTIEVRSASFIEDLQVYNIVGALTYSSNAATNFLRIPVVGQQVYIVKAVVGGEVKVRKVYVK